MKIWLLTPVLLLMACDTIDTVPDYLLLADEALLNTPEHLHYAPGKTFSWCLFERPVHDPLPDVTDTIISKLSERYTVYLRRDDIPADRKIFQDDGQLIGYVDGFSYQVRFDLLSPTRVIVYYKDWEGNLGGSSNSKVYAWSGASWNITNPGQMIVG